MERQENSLMEQAYQDFEKHGAISAAYLMRKYQLNKLAAEELCSNILKSQKTKATKEPLSDQTNSFNTTDLLSSS